MRIKQTKGAIYAAFWCLFIATFLFQVILFKKHHHLIDRVAQSSHKRQLLALKSAGKTKISQSALMPLEEASQNRDGDFSACLITMDDNHWLVEWLAYHYYAASLRHLVIVRDPRSFTSPGPILNRWRNLMTIEEWDDERFLPKWVHSTFKRENFTDLWLHLNRQMFFYSECMKHFKSQNKTWVMMTDTDEFLRVNPAADELNETILQQQGHVAAHLRQNKVEEKCLSVPRIQVTSEEAPASEKAIVPGLNTSHFLTYRWLLHNGKPMKHGKSIVNVQNLLRTDIPEKASSVHAVIDGICPPGPGDRKRLGISSPESDLLSVQHYLGSIEQFTYRNDPRNKDGHLRLEQWHTRGRNPSAKIPDNGLKPWLVGFVDYFGLKEARRLLNGVGTLEEK